MLNSTTVTIIKCGMLCHEMGFIQHSVSGLNFDLGLDKSHIHLPAITMHSDYRTAIRDVGYGCWRELPLHITIGKYCTS